MVPQNIMIDLPIFAFNFRTSSLPLTITSLRGHLYQPIKTRTIASFCPLTLDYLPTSLTKLSVSCNCPVDNLPKSLLTLNLKGCFNRPIDHLPSSLTHLTMGYQFKLPVDNLPSLTFLKLNSSFNHNLDNLPSSLTSLSLKGMKYSLPLDFLPPSLKYLRLQMWDQPADYLPPALKTFVVTARFNFPGDNL